MGSRRQVDQVRRYKDTLKTSLKQLQINPTTLEDLARNRPTWRRTVKTGAAIYEANRIAAAKTKRAARKSPAPRNNTAHVQALSKCPRCQRPFRARIGLVKHLRTQCTTIRKFQLLRPILPPLLRIPLPSPLASVPLLQPS
ncbi:unnamed protein product [Schistocephalus solidus]|uniref:C2H2-type domain-containing protein n=1 Tax=Schistocephalus solidus TaxID=70667 RepID=A0A183T566_SCHSO|nr:unnamed protein product [Schistocephalus solidus]